MAIITYIKKVLTTNYYYNTIISEVQPYREFFFFPYTFQNIKSVYIILVVDIQSSFVSSSESLKS